MRYQTLAGFILDELGAVPTPGTTLRAAGYLWTVLEVDGPRILKLKAQTRSRTTVSRRSPRSSACSAPRGPARILDSTILKSWERNDVWRVRVTGGADLPAMVIVKQWKSEPARGLDEWAALAVLTEAGLVAAPRFLGGDADARCFVMEDLARADEALLRDPGRESVPQRPWSRSRGSRGRCTWTRGASPRSSTGAAMGSLRVRSPRRPRPRAGSASAAPTLRAGSRR